MFPKWSLITCYVLEQLENKHTNAILSKTLISLILPLLRTANIRFSSLGCQSKDERVCWPWAENIR